MTTTTETAKRTRIHIPILKLEELLKQGKSDEEIAKEFGYFREGIRNPVVAFQAVKRRLMKEGFVDPLTGEHRFFTGVAQQPVQRGRRGPITPFLHIVPQGNGVVDIETSSRRLKVSIAQLKERIADAEAKMRAKRTA